MMYQQNKIAAYIYNKKFETRQTASLSNSAFQDLSRRNIC